MNDTLLLILVHMCFHPLTDVFSYIPKEFPKDHEKKLANDTYQMSGKTGSLRYMVS